MCKSLARKSVVCISHRGHGSGRPGRAFEAWLRGRVYLLGAHVFATSLTDYVSSCHRLTELGLDRSRIKMNQVRLLVHCASLP